MYSLLLLLLLCRGVAAFDLVVCCIAQVDAEDHTWFRQQEGELCVPGLTGDTDLGRTVFRCGEVPDFPPLRILVSWDWKGDHNANSQQLFLRITRRGNPVVRSKLSNSSAQQDWESKRVILDEEELVELFEECEHQDEFEICVSAKETLYFRNFCFCVERRAEGDMSYQTKFNHDGAVRLAQSVGESDYADRSV
jgi:hypothetical protein